MSGVAVIYQRDGRPVEPEQLGRMVDAMRHRGPHGLAQHVSGPVGLGHGLMHTTPESLRERQPLANPDGSCWIVWDGRLDHRDELLQTLKAAGAPDDNAPDPALVLAAYQRWGQDCVRHLLGEFAFVIWDQRTRTLVGARDRIGLKPFHYSQQGPTLLIASEAKTIVSVLDRTPEPDDVMVLAMFFSEFREADHHRSWFAGIHRLPPGHVLIATPERLRVERYWQLDPSHQTRYSRPEAYVEHFRALFEDAVKCRARSAFPIGCLLSGGLDSSAITAVAAESAAMVEAVTTFSSKDPASDERRWARHAAHAAGVRLWEFCDEGRDPLDGLDELLWTVESPLAISYTDRAGFSALARSRNWRVLLDGDGGDQLLDEYGYLADVLLGRGPARCLRETRAFAGWYGASTRELAATALGGVVPLWARAIGKRVRQARQFSWVNPALVRSCAFTTRFHEPRAPLACASHSQRLSCELALSPYLVLKLELAEREAAAQGRELWYPFLDHRLVEFVLSIPWEQRCHDGQRKWLLREAMRDRLPETLRLRQGKGDWSAAMDDAVSALCRRAGPEPLANRSGLMDRYVHWPGVQALLERYLTRTRAVRWNVWSLVALDHWLMRIRTGGDQHATAAIVHQAPEALPLTEAASLR